VIVARLIHRGTNSQAVRGIYPESLSEDSVGVLFLGKGWMAIQAFAPQLMGGEWEFSVGGFFEFFPQPWELAGICASKRGDSISSPRTSRTPRPAPQQQPEAADPGGAVVDEIPSVDASPGWAKGSTVGMEWIPRVAGNANVKRNAGRGILALGTDFDATPTGAVWPAGITRPTRQIIPESSQHIWPRVEDWHPDLVATLKERASVLG
jgi:hypothetical protein